MLRILMLWVLATAAYGAPEVERFLNAAEGGFADWDSNRDQVLTSSELDRAIASPSVTGDRAAAAVALRRVMRSRSLNVRVLRMETLRALARSEVSAEETDEGAQDGARSAVQYFEAALRRIQGTERALFGRDGPTLEALRQGRLGSCFCLAPLGSMVHRDPAEVRRLFEPQPDGSVKVFFEGGKRAVSVPPLTDGEIALGSGSRSSGTWPAVFEKAVGLLQTPDRPSRDGQIPTPYAVVTRGGSAGNLLALLTGTPVVRFSCRAWRSDPPTPPAELERSLAELRRLLTTSLKARLLVTAATPGAAARGPHVPNLAPSHAFSVLAYDPVTDRVTFRDPHAQSSRPRGPSGLRNGYPIVRGVWSAPLTEVVQFMGGFSFQTNDESAPSDAEES